MIWFEKLNQIAVLTNLLNKYKISGYLNFILDNTNELEGLIFS
jgi:hypothetical protein